MISLAIILTFQRMLSLRNRRTGSLRNMRSRFRLSVILKNDVLHVPKGKQGKRKKQEKWRRQVKEKQSERGNNGSIWRANWEKREYRGGSQITKETELLHIKPLSPLPTLCAASRPQPFHPRSLFSNDEKPRPTFALASLQLIRPDFGLLVWNCYAISEWLIVLETSADFSVVQFVYSYISGKVLLVNS